jgi:hypothetical protein
MHAAPAASPTLAWEIDIPLVTNAYMVRTMLRVSLGSAAVVAALVSMMLAVQGAWDVIPPLLALFAAAGLGFFVLSLLIMLLVFGNRFKARFVVDAQGVRYETLDRVARAGNRAALAAGLLLGRPGAAGSGLLAMTQEDQALRWAGAFHAEVDAARRTITLRNGWRTLMMVYCTPDNFEAVRARVSERMAAQHTAERASARSPLGRYLRRTALVVLASLPCLLLAPVYGLGLLLPLLLLCFAVAMVWFVRPLAWVVLALAALLAAQVLLAALVTRESSVSRGSHYLRYEVLSGDDLALTALAAAGLAYLCWQAALTLKARVLPVLEADERDGGGA